jgi:hypothetical protein
VSCVDLSVDTTKQLAERHPGATFVLKTRRGKFDAAKSGTPNEWCEVANLPHFMYLPVPDGAVDEAMLERHLDYWLTNSDWDEERQEGFWMLTAYKKHLPRRYGYLADRIMNLQLATEWDVARHNEALRRTVRGILALAPTDTDWEPYLARSRAQRV